MKSVSKYVYILAVIALISAIPSTVGCGGMPATPTATAPVNGAPAVNSMTAPKEVAPGVTAELTCVASDPDSDALTYVWASKDGKITGTGPEVKWTAPAAAGSYTVDVTVTDGRGGQATKSAAINVIAKPNMPPKLTAFNITRPDKSQVTIQAGDTNPLTVQAMTTIQINVTAEDPEGDPYNILWACTEGGKLDGKDNNVKFLALTKSTDVTITATIIDSKGALSKTRLFIKVPCCGEGQFGQSGT